MSDSITFYIMKENTISLSLTLSPFSWPFFRVLLELRMMEVVVTTGAITHAKLVNQS